MQEPGKFNFEINIMPNELEKYMSFIINNKLRFIDSLPFLSFSLNNSVKNMDKDGFNYFSQELDSNI